MCKPATSHPPHGGRGLRWESGIIVGLRTYRFCNDDRTEWCYGVLQTA